MSARVRSEIEGPVAILTLDRPEKLNAIDGPMIEALEAWVEAVEADRTIRVAILTGSGKAFSAGGDIDGLGRARSHRFRAALDSRGPSRLRPAGAPAPAADRGPQRPGFRRGAGAGGHRRSDHRFGGRAARPARDRARHDSGLGGHSAPGPPLRQPPGEAHGAGRADTHSRSRRWPVASSMRWRRRARPWRGPERWPPTSPAAGPVAVQIVKQLINAAEGEERESAMESLAGRLRRLHRRFEGGGGEFS